jgi:AcrR family transcriptional regulator
MFVKGPRRVPSQERSKQRVERILDAASLEIAEKGFDAATMEGIAARAGTSIGSVYQFYPNKVALYHALASRYVARVRAFFDVTMSGPLVDRPWTEMLDAAIDAFVAFHEADPGFRAVWVGLHLTPEVLSEGEAVNREAAERIADLLRRKLPGMPARKRSIVATMVVEVFSAMLILAARRPSDAAAVVAETKAMLRRYLEPYESAPKAGRAEVRSGRRTG